ncbi:glycosyltransferase [Candidatus Woesearchaeota archaeon]|nr:glycosyltransferase [Candidatus Woesearchaeota archaeon]
MKIYYASQSFYPHIGGVSTYLLNLANEMTKKGNEVVEVHLRPSGEENYDEIKGIKVHRVPKEPVDKKIMRKYSRFKEAVYKGCHQSEGKFKDSVHEMEGFTEFNTVNEYFGEEIKGLLEQNPADIVHIHDFQLLFSYKYVPRGTPLILTWHIPFIENMDKGLSEFLVKHLKEYDKVVFSSNDYIRAAVNAGLPKKKTELIYPIANTGLFRVLDVDKAEVKKKYGLPVNSKVVLCVQRVDPKSGHEQLINAFPKVLKKVPDARLVFVGGQSMSNKLSKDREVIIERVNSLVKKLRMEKKVIFLGNIPYNSLPELYNSSDLVALCSKNEGFGLSVTEGMACGKPIIGTKVGGIPIQVKNRSNGFLVDVGDIDSTAGKIIKVLSDSRLRKAMSLSSLKAVEDNFKIERGIEKHVILYNQVKKIKDEFHKVEYLNIPDVKAIVTDLDRTITDKPPKHEFDEKDYDKGLLKELKSLNENLILATGRPFYYVRKMCSRLNFWRCIVSENGAVIYFPKKKKTISINTYYMKKAKRMIRELELPGTVVGKIIISIKEGYKDIVEEKLSRIKDKVKLVRNVDEIMITPLEIDKGSGLQIAMQHLNLDMDKAIMIGDGENDIDMFLNPGFKIALANADKKLKKLADQVTKMPSTRGVREIIKKLRMRR